MNDALRAIERVSDGISTLSDDVRRPCQILMDELLSPDLRDAPGSRLAHQAWPGGYFCHVAETFDIAMALYHSLSSMRPLEFTIDDALLVLFLHDLEKPYRYGRGMDINKSNSHAFKLSKIKSVGLQLTPTQLNALRYVEGEGDDYAPGQRMMGPLAAFCHMCDVCSARIWFDQPRPLHS